MSRSLPAIVQSLEFDQEAGRYLEWLKKEHPEHFMEAPPQATQRQISVCAFELMQPHRSDFYYYSELLVQWRNRRGEIHKVVPDNMVVVSSQPPKVRRSYDVPLQPAGPFWVLEYVSKSNPRKDYQQSTPKYEKELKVPYFLIFVPDEQELTLFRHNGRRYVSVKPDAQDRVAIPELDLEMGIHESWVRYWFRGQLLPLPTELQQELDQARQQITRLRRQSTLAAKRASQAELEANQARSQADQAQQRLARLAALSRKARQGLASPEELRELEQLEELG